MRCALKTCVHVAFQIIIGKYGKSQLAVRALYSFNWLSALVLAIWSNIVGQFGWETHANKSWFKQLHDWFRLLQTWVRCTFDPIYTESGKGCISSVWLFCWCAIYQSEGSLNIFCPSFFCHIYAGKCSFKVELIYSIERCLKGLICLSP